MELNIMMIFGGIEISEAALRFSMFAFVLITMVALEVALPKRELSESKSRRWITNFAIVGIDSLAVRLLARLPEFFGAIATPLAAVGAAMAAEHYQIGLFHWIALPDVVVFVATRSSETIRSDSARPPWPRQPLQAASRWRRKIPAAARAAGRRGYQCRRWRNS
ncbi:MAG: hypothetical protein AAFV26_03535 [Pseudomonadota bacterium]